MKPVPAQPDPAAPISLADRIAARNRSLEGEREVPVLPAVVRAAQPVPVSATAAVSLKGEPKAVFVMGPGRTGKTTFLRWVVENTDPKGDGAMIAALDPQNRSLATFVNNVDQPPTHDAETVAAWTESLLGIVMAEQASVLLDMGGGDLSLGYLLREMPDLAGSLEGAGVHPVAIYTLSPRVDDLTVLAGYEAQGFQPKATALVLNLGLAPVTMEPEEAFARVLRHSAFRAAVERGAVPVWMPRLQAAVSAEIEGKRLSFAQARDGRAPEEQPGAVLGPFDRLRVRHWLAGMETAFAPVRSWLP